MDKLVRNTKSANSIWEPLHQSQALEIVQHVPKEILGNLNELQNRTTLALKNSHVNILNCHNTR